MNNYKIVSIDGNIGSGKSTLLENLKEHYKENKYVIFLREPVDEWEHIKDRDGVTMLQKFYSDQEKYSFAFQMMAYISRLKILRDTINKIKDSSEKYVIITERSLYTDKNVFAKMLHEQGKMDDVCYQIYLKWFDEFTVDFPVDYTIYVKTSPENCYNRIHKRSRVGEEVIPLSYLSECHKYHEEFLDDISGIKTIKLILNGNMDIFTNEEIVENWLHDINNLIF
jgi:deoxyadenosine/deoxycytidine kinase